MSKQPSNSGKSTADGSSRINPTSSSTSSTSTPPTTSSSGLEPSLARSLANMALQMPSPGGSVDVDTFASSAPSSPRERTGIFRGTSGGSSTAPGSPTGTSIRGISNSSNSSVMNTTGRTTGGNNTLSFSAVPFTPASFSSTSSANPLGTSSTSSSSHKNLTSAASGKSSSTAVFATSSSTTRQQQQQQQQFVMNPQQQQQLAPHLHHHHHQQQQQQQSRRQQQQQLQHQQHPSSSSTSTSNETPVNPHFPPSSAAAGAPYGSGGSGRFPGLHVSAPSSSDNTPVVIPPRGSVPNAPPSVRTPAAFFASRPWRAEFKRRTMALYASSSAPSQGDHPSAAAIGSTSTNTNTNNTSTTTGTATTTTNTSSSSASAAAAAVVSPPYPDSGADHPILPPNIRQYHSLFNLDLPSTSNPPRAAGTTGLFRFPTTAYKAISSADGGAYVLRRVDGFRANAEYLQAVLDAWRGVSHPNLIPLVDIFVSKEFGDVSSAFFVYDYYPGAQTLQAKFFARRLLQPIPEPVIWSILIQLTAVLRVMHAHGMACRTIHPSKILISGRARIRINGVGVLDALDGGKAVGILQQEDLVALGRLLGALCGGSNEAAAANYSQDLCKVIGYLLSTSPRALPNVYDLAAMISPYTLTEVDHLTTYSDALEADLSREIENGRLFRLLTKLCFVNDRPELLNDTKWAETGDRYLLKLFLDYLFHQVDEERRPALDLAHVIDTLNKLDMGSNERIALMSRDEQNVLIVSFADLKKAIGGAFQELVTAQQIR